MGTYYFSDKSSPQQSLFSGLDDMESNVFSFSFSPNPFLEGIEFSIWISIPS